MGNKPLPTLIVVLAAIFSLAAASASPAAELRGRSSTQVISFLDFYKGRQVDVAEYLRFSLTGLDNAGRLAFYGYGRGTQDLNNGEGFHARLYSLYGDYRDLLGNRVDTRFGRQFTSNSAGTALLDGVQVTLKNVGPVAFTLFGGRDVVFGVDTETGHRGNYAMGATAALAGFANTDADISWFRKTDDGDVARELVGGSFKQYLFKKVKLYGDARYDTTARVFNEALGGIKYFPAQSTVFTGEYYSSYPTFDTTSIYSVFAVDRYREAVFRVDYFLAYRFSVNAGYTREAFGDGGNADVYEIGARFRPTNAWEIEVAVDDRHGYPGHLYGFSVDALYDVNKQWQVGAGAAYDKYERDFFPSTSGEHGAQLYWLGAKHQLAKNMRAQARIEDARNTTYSNAVQGRVVFDYDF